MMMGRKGGGDGGGSWWDGCLGSYVWQEDVSGACVVHAVVCTSPWLSTLQHTG